MKSVWRYIILCFLLLFLLAAKSDDQLSKYLEALDSSKAYRSFSLDDSSLLRYNRTFKDRFGYFWKSSYGGAEAFYRFNGHEWQNMRSFLPEKAFTSQRSVRTFVFNQQHLLPVKDGLYLWQGHSFVKYLAPQGTAVIDAQVLGDKLLVIFDKGYGVLQDGIWRYYNRKVPDIVVNNSGLFGITIINLGDSKRTNILYGLDGLNNLFVAAYETNFQYDGTGYKPPKPLWDDKGFYLLKINRNHTDSLLISRDNVFIASDDPQREVKPILRCEHGSIFVLFQGSDRGYIVNPQSLKVSQLPLTENEWILGTNQDKSEEELRIYTTDQNSVYRYKCQNGDKATALQVVRNAKLNLPQPISHYNELILIDHDSSQTINTGNDKSKAMKKDRLLVLDKHGELELFQPEGIGDDYDIIAQQGYLLGTKYDDATHTSSIKVVDIAKNTLYSICLPDEVYPSSAYVDGENRQLWISTAKLSWLCSFEVALKKISEIEGDYYQTIGDSHHSGYGFSSEWKSDSSTLFCYEQTQQGGFKQIRRLENVRERGTSPTRQLLYYSRETDASRDIYSYSFPKDDERLLYSAKPGSRISTQDSLLFLHKGDWYQLGDGAQYKITGSLQRLSAYLQPFLIDSELSQQDILDEMDFRILSSEYIFAPPQRISLKRDDNASGNSYDILYNYSKRVNELPHRCRVRKDRGITYLDLPSLLIHLRGGQCDYKVMPNVLKHYYSMGSNYLSYIDSTASGYQIRLSELECKSSGIEASGLVKHDQDFQLRLDGPDIPEVRFQIKDGRIVALSPHTVHYLRQDDSGKSSWYRADLSEFDYLKDYGGRIVSTDSELWISYVSGLVKHSLVSGISFAYDAKDGIPRYANVWNYNNTIHIKVYSGPEVYQINSLSSQVKVSLPWIEGRNKRFSTQKAIQLNYSFTDLRIPLDILNVMYPEKCVVEYRLLGYDDTWKRRNFVPELEYNKLKPGKYALEVKAYSQDGYVSPIAVAAFQIHPPLWATWWAYLIYIVVVVWIFRFLFLARTKQLKAHNLALEQQVFDRTYELQQKQHKLTESIEYASLIQRSMLPPEVLLQQLFQQHFILWKPRDIVGGDFYWLHQIPDSTMVIFALIDCTGHGVPGALLSMTVNSLMKSVIQDRKIYEPAKALEILHNELGAALYQDMGDNQQDGFEISLIKLDPEKRELLFAGAGHNLVYSDAEGLQMLFGDRYGIGGLKRRVRLSFHSKSLCYSQDSIIYLYSDGILDQPNPHAAMQKRLGTKAFLPILEGIYQSEISSQKTVLEELIKDMLRHDEQRDDITIIGLKPG